MAEIRTHSLEMVTPNGYRHLVGYYESHAEAKEEGDMILSSTFNDVAKYSYYDISETFMQVDPLNPDNQWL